MASIQKTPAGKYRAQVYRRGVRKSQVFDTHRAAKAWAARAEYELDHTDEIHSALPFGDLLDRYGREVSAKKRGARSEIIRIERLRRDKIAKRPIGELTVLDFADWRDRRLTQVQPASVRRELEQLSAVLRQARTEWGLMSRNPLEGLQWPAQAVPRDRRPTPAELDALAISAGDDMTTATARTFQAFLFAIETAMRCGEIAALEWRHLDLARRVAHLPNTKNGFARDVPLSSEAVRIIERLPKADPVFGLTAEQISSLFRKVTARAAVVNLRFHDSRHEAVTRLARKLDVLDLARMTGHRNIRELMTYFNATAEELARRLD